MRVPTKWPEPPVHVTGEGRVAWDHLCKLLDGRDGFICAEYEPLMAIYSVAFARWRAANDRVQADGLTQEGRRNGQVKHPLLSTITSSGVEMTRVLGQLGLSAVKRDKISTSVPEDDPFAELLRSRIVG